MRRALHLAWAFLERAFPRLAAAVTLVATAAAVTPADFGLYAWAVLALTVFQSLAETAGRQLAVRAASSEDGRMWLRRYARVAGFVGFAWVTLAIGAVSLLADTQGINAWGAIPLALVPVLNASGVLSVARLQLDSRWPTLALGQLVASAIALPLGIALAVYSKSILALATQAMLAELIFLTWCKVRSRSVHLADTGQAAPSKRDFGHLAANGLLGWGQSQTDRLLVGAWAGTYTLGLFSTASSLGKSLGEAVAASSANLLRARIATLNGSRDAAQEAGRVLVSAAAIAALGAAALLLLTHTFLSTYFPANWQPALQAAVVMALAAVPSVWAWNAAAILDRNGQVWKLLPIRIFAIALAIPVALTATFDLVGAAWTMVVRDAVILLIIQVILRNSVTTRSSVLTWLIFGAAIFIVLIWD